MNECTSFIKTCTLIRILYPDVLQIDQLVSELEIKFCCFASIHLINKRMDNIIVEKVKPYYRIKKKMFVGI